MASLFRKLCCCGANATSPVPVRSSAPAARNPNPNRNSANRHSQQGSNVTTSSERRRSQQPKIVKKFLKLKSSYSIDTVKVADTRTEDQKDLRFNCPICFRFFDRILISSCCGNYLCHFCANDVNEKVKKDDKTPVARCMFCNSEDFELTDVDPNEKPKKYTDSFYSTFGKGTQGKDGFNNKLALKTKDQLYLTSNKSDFEQNVIGLEVNRMAKSDGIIYMRQEMERERLGNTVGAESLGAARMDNERDYIRIMPDDRIVGDDLQRSGTNVEEPLDSSGSINERAPIDIIQEDEFESSVVPEIDRRLPE